MTLRRTRATPEPFEIDPRRKMRDVAQAGRVVSFILFDVANSARGDIVSMVTATLRFTRVSVRRRRNEVKSRLDR